MSLSDWIAIVSIIMSTLMSVLSMSLAVHLFNKAKESNKTLTLPAWLKELLIELLETLRGIKRQGERTKQEDSHQSYTVSTRVDNNRVHTDLESTGKQTTQDVTATSVLPKRCGSYESYRPSSLFVPLN